MWIEISLHDRTGEVGHEFSSLKMADLAQHDLLLLLFFLFTDLVREVRFEVVGECQIGRVCRVHGFRRSADRTGRVGLELGLHAAPMTKHMTTLQTGRLPHNIWNAVNRRVCWFTQTDGAGEVFDIREGVVDDIPPALQSDFGIPIQGR